MPISITPNTSNNSASLLKVGTGITAGPAITVSVACAGARLLPLLVINDPATKILT